MLWWVRLGYPTGLTRLHRTLSDSAGSHWYSGKSDWNIQPDSPDSSIQVGLTCCQVSLTGICSHHCSRSRHCTVVVVVVVVVYGVGIGRHQWHINGSGVGLGGYQWNNYSTLFPPAYSDRTRWAHWTPLVSSESDWSIQQDTPGSTGSSGVW